MRNIQTPTLIAILRPDLTHRLIFMDGRTLEADPHRTWMGYSVGRWEGETLVVDSFGFNDKTWLSSRGLPHTEALRITERYRRDDFGHLRILATFMDPGAFSKPWSVEANMELAVDTEMIEAVCETRSDGWTGTLSDTRSLGVRVATDVLSRYIGTYSGVYAGRPRTVEVTLVDGELFITIAGETDSVVPMTETLFETTRGLAYEFIRNGPGPATDIVEIHVSGNYRYARQR
jgi:hypothetical protein